MQYFCSLFFFSYFRCIFLLRICFTVNTHIDDSKIKKICSQILKKKSHIDQSVANIVRRVHFRWCSVESTWKFQSASWDALKTFQSTFTWSKNPSVLILHKQACPVLTDAARTINKVLMRIFVCVRVGTYLLTKNLTNLTTSLLISSQTSVSL